MRKIFGVHVSTHCDATKRYVAIRNNASEDCMTRGILINVA